jgi:hypothetical protein
MTPSRVEAYLHSIQPSDESQGRSGSGLGELCAEIVGVTGAGIMLMAEGDHRGCLSASNEVMALLEDLQFTLGHGPCIDAFHTQLPVLEPDLDAPTAARWSMFVGPAVDAGVRAVFAYPLLVEGTCLGALDLYNDAPGLLDDAQQSEAEATAKVVSEVVLTLEADTWSGDLPVAFKAASRSRAIVYQAAGMASVQLNISVDDALVKLRADAFASGRPVNDLALEIRDRRYTLGT